METIYIGENKVEIALIETNLNKVEKKFVIKVDRGTDTKELEITGSYYTPESNFMVAAGNEVFIMLDNQLLLFNPENMRITKKANLDILGTMIAAYPYQDDFILHGEIEILRINKKLEVLWTFSGIDIFARQNGSEKAIEFHNDKICLHDFYDNYYEIDYNGILKTFKRNDHEDRFKEVRQF